MNTQSASDYVDALHDFQAARRKGALSTLLARLRGQTSQLLSYEEVRQKLNALPGAERGLQDIPIDHIVGSVSRYTDFTRNFLPRQQSDQDRWARVKTAVSSMAGVPPIVVYKLSDTYFVIDGHHRISVARDLGATSIQAYVTEVKARVPLTPDVKPEDLIIKSELVDFLEQTRLDQLRPGSRLEVTVPGQYRLLAEHIDVHRYYMGQEQKRAIPYEKAVSHWYDTVYLPVVETMQQHGILRDFPDRTETDLYLWLAEHRAAVEKELGWEVKPAAAYQDLAAQYGARIGRLANRLGKALVPRELEAGPPPGEWRRARPAEDVLFAELLVPVNGQAGGWNALEQAFVIARREAATLHGLHVVATPAEMAAAPAAALKAEFGRRLQSAGLPGELSLAAGTVVQQVYLRSSWVDLIVVNLTYPPGERPLARLSSGFSNLIRRGSRPILAVPGRTYALNSALLAYDGSPKGDEALFMATYLACRWQIPLTVMTVLDTGEVAPETLPRARLYLEEHGLTAEYEVGHGQVASNLLLAAEAHNCDLIIMGGYGNKPLLEVMLGSSVDQVLRSARRPVLICR